MEQVVYHGIDIDRCIACGGLWFDNLEHEKLKDVPGSDVLDSGDPKVGKVNNAIGDIECPRCTAQMVKMVDLQQPHIHYEQCGVCGGVYFDAGEFRDLQQESVIDLVRGWFAKPRM